MFVENLSSYFLSAPDAGALLVLLPREGFRIKSVLQMGDVSAGGMTVPTMRRAPWTRGVFCFSPFSEEGPRGHTLFCALLFSVGKGFLKRSSEERLTSRMKSSELAS